LLHLFSMMVRRRVHSGARYLYKQYTCHADFARHAPCNGSANPAGIAVAPEGRQMYVSNGADASVMLIDAAMNAVSATVAVGKRPWNMALTPDGRRLYVANGRPDSVSVIDTAGARKVADIAVGQLPWGVVIR
jgi:YVTN family beta-propeller protein